MRKLSLLLALVPLWACRSPQEATQTVIRIHATPAMQQRVTHYKTEVFSLPDNTPRGGGELAEVRWPVKRVFVPASRSSNHHFRYVFYGLDPSGAPITTLDIESEVVPGASRYLYILLSEDCLANQCDGGVCKASVGASALRISPEQAQSLEVSCSGGSLTPPPLTTPTETSPTEGSAGSDATAEKNNAITAGGPESITTGDAGTTATPRDAGPPMDPASTVEACSGDPCAAGTCHLNGAAALGYECTCNTGFEPNEAASTCVPRNDCLKADKGGCEDACEPNPTTGEGICSCEGPRRWRKADATQCAEVNEAIQLTTSEGSTVRTRPQVAFDPAGNGVVVWTETSRAGTASLWTARFEASTKQWTIPSRPFRLAATDPADLHLALDANGAGVLLWTGTVSSKRQMWATRYRDGAFASTAERVDDHSQGDVLMPSLALDTMGDGLVAWTDTVYPRSLLRVARYFASTDTFMLMENVRDAGDRLVVGTSVATHSATGGLIAWTELPVETLPDAGPVPDLSNYTAFNSRVGSSLSTGTSFAATGLRSTSPDVVLDALGHGVGVWVEGSSTTALRVVAARYIAGMGFGGPRAIHTLSERGDIFSTPRVVMGADGTAFAVWRQTMTSSTSSTEPSSDPRHTYGALRFADGFRVSQELGRPSDPIFWSELANETWTPETTVTFFDLLQPSWSSAVGPEQTGFIAGASFSSSASPPTRELWLQRLGPDDQPSELIPLSPSDTVPSFPSPVRLGLNANGDGAVVWDRQIDGRYHVFVNLID